MALQPISLAQVDEIINKAAAENMLCHYNGGQAYIQLTETTLMVIDHGCANITIQFYEGTQYFKEWAGSRFSISKIMREQGSKLAEIHALV
jgi:hypothetical protein